MIIAVPGKSDRLVTQVVESRQQFEHAIQRDGSLVSVAGWASSPFNGQYISGIIDQGDAQLREPAVNAYPSSRHLIGSVVIND